MSSLATFVHHPRKLWLRRVFFQIHLWAGALLSLYVVIIALTGSILVFRAELARARLPRTLTPYAADHTAPIATVLERFRTSYPQAKIDDLQLPSSQLPAFLLSATDSHQHPFMLLADPVTANLIPQPRNWLTWIYALHVYLLLGEAHGMQVNGVGAAVLLLLTVTGLFLWWPGIKIWSRGLRIGLGHSWRRINYDAHSAIGFWTLFLVFWWAFSGIYFAWYKQVSATVALVSPLKGMLSPTAPPQPNPGPAKPNFDSPRATLDQILSTIHHASPNGQLFSISDPALTASTIYALVDLRAPGDFSHRDIITLSTTDARVLTIWHYGQNHTLGDWILWSMHPLHFGTLWGIFFKIIWCLCGLALAVLTITGLLMYWNRFLRHKLPG